MADMKKMPIKHRQYTIGDMRHLVDLVWMDMTSPAATGSFDATITKTFTKQVWAAVDTLPAVNFFNEANVDNLITHIIGIRWFAGFNFNSTQYRIRMRRISTSDVPEYEWFKIIDSEDLDKRREFILLKCSIKGQESDVEFY